MSCKLELVKKKIQLNSYKQANQALKTSLNEAKGFRYQIALKVIFKKYKLIDQFFQFNNKNSDKS